MNHHNVHLKHLSSILVLSSLTLGGCKEINKLVNVNSSSSIEATLRSSIEANKSASTYAEWHSSDLHPEKIFSQLVADLLQGKTNSADVCSALSKMSDADLTLFENELSAAEYAPVVASCKVLLSARIEGFWENLKASLNSETDSEEKTKKVVANATQANRYRHSSPETATPSTTVTASSDNGFTFSDTEVELRDTSNGYSAINGDTKSKQVILTFDDGPHVTNTPKILDTLKQANARVMFFHVGTNTRRYPLIVQREASLGHAIGSHSNTHACLPSKRLCKNSNGGHILSVDEAIAEIKSGHQAIQDVLGWVEPFFRFPYGESSADLKSYLKQNSTADFLWNIDSEDWRVKMPNGEVNTPAMVIDRVMKELRAEGHGIILFHDIQRKTAEALPTLLKRLYNEGFQPTIIEPKDGNARFNSKIAKHSSSNH